MLLGAPEAPAPRAIGAELDLEPEVAVRPLAAEQLGDALESEAERIHVDEQAPRCWGTFVATSMFTLMMAAAVACNATADFGSAD